MAMREEHADKSGAVWETVKVIIHALIIAFVVRVFLYQPFNIPSGSMKSTLLVGDYLFVSKMSYGYSRHSIPGSLNLFSGRIWSSFSFTSSRSTLTSRPQSNCTPTKHWSLPL